MQPGPDRFYEIKKTRNEGTKRMIICRGCDRHVFEGTKVCPFCQSDVIALGKLHEKRMREARKAYRLLL